jgi:phosphoribosylformimino-5-aminoimidazole carboxamide ribotide isomerase
MDVIPAVDIMKGKVVRLLRGDPKFVKSYAHLGDPVTLARKWESEGARIIHVIDLDAALELGSNLEAIEEIVKAIKVPVQVGGGIRSLNRARTLLNKGVNKVILGSLAFEEPSTVKALLDEFGEDRVIVALDNLDGIVRVQGWKTSAKVTVDDAISKFSRMGVKFFLVTSVARDGTLSGPDFEGLERICRQGISVIAAGGIRSLEDLLALKRLGVCGVVVGKALYEGSFTLDEALRAIRGK